MDSECITIPAAAYHRAIDAYFNHVHAWDRDVFHYQEFEQHIGIKFHRMRNGRQCFEVVDAHKYMMAKLKYGF